jgi:hypothetical protein
VSALYTGLSSPVTPPGAKLIAGLSTPPTVPTFALFKGY